MKTALEDGVKLRFTLINKWYEEALAEITKIDLQTLLCGAPLLNQEHHIMTTHIPSVTTQRHHTDTCSRFQGFRLIHVHHVSRDDYLNVTLLVFASSLRSLTGSPGNVLKYLGFIVRDRNR